MNSEPNSSPDNDWETQLAEYTLGTMEPAMASEFERRLNECMAHVTLARQYTEVIGMLGYASNPAEPPEGHKSRFMAQLNSTPQATGEAAMGTLAPLPLVRAEAVAPPQITAPAPAEVTDLSEYRETRRRSMALPLIATLAAALVLLLGGWAWSLQNQLAVIQATKIFPVQANAPYTSTIATIAVNPKTNEVSLSVLGGLQALPSNKVYELWWLPAQTGAPPVPAGVFNANTSGKASHSAKAPNSVSNYSAVAVTLEDAPGKPAPGGPIVMVGAYTIP